MASPSLAPAKVHYPSSDGRPMAESDFQRTPLTYAVDRLRHHFRGRRDVYVSGNLLLYYQKGNPRAAVAPDVFVVLGVSNADRSSYRLWEERKGPDFVLEITSRTTYREDQGRKRELYLSLGVQEYWQYDPTRDYLEPPLQGLELSAGEYRGLPERELADGTLALASGVLGLELRLTERGLRFHDPETGQDLPNLRKPTRRVSASGRRGSGSGRRGSANGRRGKRRRRASHRKRRPASRKPRPAQPRKHGWPSWRRCCAGSAVAIPGQEVIERPLGSDLELPAFGKRKQIRSYPSGQRTDGVIRARIGDALGTTWRQG